MRRGLLWGLLGCAIGCGTGSDGGPDFGSGGTADDTGTDGGSVATSGASTGTGSDGAEAGSGGGFKFDVPAGPDAGMPASECSVGDEMDAIGDCTQKAPPMSFEPDVQWTFNGMGGNTGSWVTPLVANMTDDNDDGAIDLCDTPDVVLVVAPGILQTGRMVLLDGATGALHFEFDGDVAWAGTPAIGDIDDDGLPEVVTFDESPRLLAFEHDGSLAWDEPLSSYPVNSAVALADLDNDGDVEIVLANEVFDHHGNLLFTTPTGNGFRATATADLDGDDDHEVIMGYRAYHHDGTLYYNHPEIFSWGYPQIADLDGDTKPEVLVLAWDGISILEDDGTPKLINMRPTGDPGGDPWLRAATIHDFDGDTLPEFAVSTGAMYYVWEPDLTAVWSAPVEDLSGDGTGTAFDFLGDGIAEAMYADEHDLFVFDGAGQPLLTTPRISTTIIEYPTVADVDNDGSAEILVVSNKTPTLQVIRDAEDRWIQARRIWNQHTYHVTNVREDGTIPQYEPKHWLHLNTYRTNAQIEGGTVCQPEPEG